MQGASQPGIQTAQKDRDKHEAAASTYSFADSTPSRESAAAIPLHLATTTPRAAAQLPFASARTPRCLYHPFTRGTALPSMSHTFRSSPTSTYSTGRRQTPLHPTLSCLHSECRPRLCLCRP